MRRRLFTPSQNRGQMLEPQPRQEPWPAVFSSRHLRRDAAGLLVDFVERRATRLMPAASLLVVYAPGCVTTYGMPSRSARCSSTTNASIDFFQSSSSGLARLIRYESWAIGCVILQVGQRARETGDVFVRELLSPATGCCFW